MTLEERIEKHRKMAESYHGAYLKKEVEDGKLWDFFAYGFVETNEKCEIIRWETHVSPEYNDFLDKVLDVHGPFKDGADEYMRAVAKKMQEAGVQIHLQ